MPASGTKEAKMPGSREVFVSAGNAIVFFGSQVFCFEDPTPSCGGPQEFGFSFRCRSVLAFSSGHKCDPGDFAFDCRQKYAPCYG